jgi:hypothetical protein
LSITRAKTSSIAQGPSTNRNLLAGNPVILPGSYESIQTVTVGAGGQANITFSSIPSTYKHLQVRCFIFGSGLQYNITLNGDTGNNYSMHNLTGDGSSASAGNSINTNKILQNFLTPTSTTNPSPNITDILDYADTNKYKTVRTLNGTDSNGSGQITLVSGGYRSTSAITTVAINSGGTFTQYSSFALYGIK